MWKNADLEEDLWFFSYSEPKIVGVWEAVKKVDRDTETQGELVGRDNREVESRQKVWGRAKWARVELEKHVIRYRRIGKTMKRFESRA